MHKFYCVGFLNECLLTWSHGFIMSNHSICNNLKYLPSSFLFRFYASPERLRKVVQIVRTHTGKLQ